MNDCFYIYRHMKSWQLTNLLSEIELQLEKAPLAPQSILSFHKVNDSRVLA